MMLVAKAIVVQKSLGSKRPYGFDSHLGHNKLRLIFITKEKKFVKLTNEEWKEYNQTIGKLFSFMDEVDWLNAHHFDYRRLIEKSLTFVAPKGVYKEKNNYGNNFNFHYMCCDFNYCNSNTQ